MVIALWILHVVWFDSERVWLSHASRASDFRNRRWINCRIDLAPLCVIGVLFLDTDRQWDCSGADIEIGPSGFLDRV